MEDNIDYSMEDDYNSSNILKMTLHSQTGLRYMHLKWSLEEIERYYKKEDLFDYKMHLVNHPVFTQLTEKTFLRQHLKFWLNKLLPNGGTSITYCPIKYGMCHIPLILRAKEDGRRELPTSIYKTLMDNNQMWKSRKVNLTWIVCFLNNIDPDDSYPDWDRFQCSHLCLGAGKNLPCLNGNHLCWESAARNQSRGTRDCLKICHCGCKRTICEANQIHIPYCKSPPKK